MIRCPSCAGSLQGADLTCGRCGKRPWNGRYHDFLPQGGVEGFDAIEFRYRFGAEPRHYWHRARLRLLLEAVGQVGTPGDALLEVGCGCGHLSRAFTEAGYRVWAVDVSEAALDLAATQGIGHVGRATIADLPFADEFDLACAFDVLEHVPDPRGALEGLVRSVRAGGRVLVTVPAGPELWGSWDRKQRHLARYSPADLVGLMEGAGLQDVHVVPFFATLYVPVRAAASVDRLLGGPRRWDVPLPQHHAMWNPPLLGPVAEWILAHEGWLPRRIRRRGTSLLASGKKPL